MKKVFRSNLLVVLLLVFLVGCGNKKTDEPKSSDSSVAISSSVKKSSESTTSSSTKESSTKESSTSVATSESISVSLADFVGGWGLPQSDSLFFIASDGSFTPVVVGPGESVPSYPNYSFSLTSDGKPIMYLDGTSEFILEPNGTLTVDGRTYEYLGNYTIDEFRAKKAAEDQALMEEQARQEQLENQAQAEAEASWQAEVSREAEKQPVYSEETYESLESYEEEVYSQDSPKADSPTRKETQPSTELIAPPTPFVDAEGNGLIKGSENGIYHVPGSTYYSRVTNPVAMFSTVDEAKDAGYRAPER